MGIKGLKDNIAVVTGGGSGIGRSICIRLAQEGAKVMVTDINESGAEATRTLIEEKGGYAESYKMDVTDKEMVKQVVEQIDEKHGKIDILISNAGFSTPPAFCYKMEDDDWDKLIKVHLYGTFNTVKACGGIMKSRGYGRIVVTSSLAGVFGLTGNINYAAAKTALVGVTYTLAKEMGPFGITVNAVQPGIIRTPITEAPLQAMEEKFVKETPVPRIGEPEDVANAVSFFCQPESDFVTGVVMRVDGGYVLQSGMDQLMMGLCTQNS